MFLNVLLMFQRVEHFKMGSKRKYPNTEERYNNIIYILSLNVPILPGKSGRYFFQLSVLLKKIFCPNSPDMCGTFGSLSSYESGEFPELKKNPFSKCFFVFLRLNIWNFWNIKEIAGFSGKSIGQVSI